MAKYTLRNLTNGPQMVGKVRVEARGTSEPIELDDFNATLIARTGIFRVDAVSDPFAGLDDDAVKTLYETTTGKKPGKLTRAKMLAVLNG